MNTAIKSYKRMCANEEIENNPKQEDLVNKLSEFLIVNDKNLLRQIFSYKREKNNKNCFYIHGKVGVGKTLIMDISFDNFNSKSKKRIHFHEFMIQTHESLHKLRKDNQNNKDFLISKFAKKISKENKFLFFDEFQVTNIADAMILGHLFSELFKNNVKIIITSNSHPDNLYKDGLQRELFLNFIKKINLSSYVYNLDIDTDYRKRNLELDEVYFISSSSASILKINDIHKEIKGDNLVEDKVINFKKRDFTIRSLANHSARFNFNDLCGSDTSAEDYLHLVKYVNILILENVPDFSNSNSNQQERFINLIDILYDNQVNLIMSLEKKIENLNSAYYLKDKFLRTKSRLIEMKSKNYRG